MVRVKPDEKMTMAQLPDGNEHGSGCVHLEEMMSHSAETNRKFKNSFANLQEDILNLSTAVLQTPQDPKRPHQDMAVLCPTFMCTQCTTICQMRGCREHCETRRHTFFVQTRTGYLYCAACDDFIYTDWLDKLRASVQEEVEARKKRKEELEKRKQLRMSASNSSTVLSEPKGLYNLGQSCYLSVILQAIAHNPHVTDYFLENEHKPKHCAEESCVACALNESLKQLLITEDKEGHAPVGLLHTSWLNSPVSWPPYFSPENNHSAHSQSLAGYGQQDAHEYFQFILNQLHESSGFDSPQGANDCACIAHKTFSGRLRSTVSCLTCGTLSVTFDPIVDISLDIRQEISRSTPATPLSLLDCIRNFASPERLPAVEGYLCESDECKRTAQIVTKHLTFKKLPATLCIHIKRYKIEGRVNSANKRLHCVEFPLELNMLPYTSREQDGYWRNSTPYSKWLLATDLYDRELMIDEVISRSSSESSGQSHGWYDLSSMIVHHGNLEGGHYVIYCKEGGQWLEFNDHKVTHVLEEIVLHMNPYMMFYEQRDKSGAVEPEIESDPEVESEPEEIEPEIEFESDLINWDG